MDNFKKIINLLALLIIIGIIIGLIVPVVKLMYLQMGFDGILLLLGCFVVVVILFLAWALNQ